MKTIRERPIKSDVPLKIFWGDEEDLDEKHEACPLPIEVWRDYDSVNSLQKTTKDKVEVPSFRVIDDWHQCADQLLLTQLAERPYITFTGWETLDFLLTVLVPEPLGEVNYPEVEYDIDSEDEEFLAGLTGKKWVDEDLVVFELTEKLFEEIMDFLEKQSFDEVT